MVGKQEQLQQNVMQRLATGADCVLKHDEGRQYEIKNHIMDIDGEIYEETNAK